MEEKTHLLLLLVFLPSFSESFAHVHFILEIEGGTVYLVRRGAVVTGKRRGREEVGRIFAYGSLLQSPRKEEEEEARREKLRE